MTSSRETGLPAPASPSRKAPFDSRCTCAAVVHVYGAAVLRVCQRARSSSEAEDAWTQTFLVALTAYPLLPPGANVETWLLDLARRMLQGVDRAMDRPVVRSAQ